MIRDTATVFDEWVPSQATVYTSDDFAIQLGLHDQLAICVVTDHGVGTGVGTITVTLQHSGDGVNWIAKSFVPEIDSATLNRNETDFFYAYTTSAPTLPFVRLAMTYGGGVTSGHAKIHVVMRDTSD